MKDKTNKIQYGLIPTKALKGLATVLTFGANKYTANNWQTESIECYTDAAIRHLESWRGGERLDSESGLHHLYHTMANLVFITELESNKLDNRLQLIAKDIFTWNSTRGLISINHKLIASLLAEEWGEYRNAKTLVEVLDSIGDILYISIGAIVKEYDKVTFKDLSVAISTLLHDTNISIDKVKNLTLDILEAICKSNNTKSTEIVPIGSKYSKEGKGKAYVSPELDLLNIIKSYNLEVEK